MQSRVKTFLVDFGHGWLKYCAILPIWGGQQNILRMIMETLKECHNTTLYLIEIDYSFPRDMYHVTTWNTILS